MVDELMGKSKDGRSSPEVASVYGHTGGSQASADGESVCVETGRDLGTPEGKRPLHNDNPLEDETETGLDLAPSLFRDSGFSVFRGEERDRHAVFSQAVTRALLGKQGRSGIVRVRVPDMPKCSQVLTVQELRFLLE